MGRLAEQVAVRLFTPAYTRMLPVAWVRGPVIWVEMIHGFHLRIPPDALPPHIHSYRKPRS
jgi:hypothetical protein